MNELELKELDRCLASVRAEVINARKYHAAFNSGHEGYAVLLEEVDELWDDVKSNNHQGALLEAKQVAAMAVRFMMDMAINPAPGT